jgi:hypothetical protein
MCISGCLATVGVPAGRRSKDKDKFRSKNRSKNKNKNKNKSKYKGKTRAVGFVLSHVSKARSFDFAQDRLWAPGHLRRI